MVINFASLPCKYLMKHIDTFRVVFCFIQGGGIVRFFHRTHECYIVAEGSFAGKFASKQAIADLVESHSHIPPGPESSLTLRGDTETEFSTDTAYLDTPTPTDENPPNVLGFGSHIQQVEVEVHVSSDGGDSELECPQLSSIRSYKLNKAGSIFSPESSLKVIDRAATLRKISSLTMDLTDGQHQHVVTENGEWPLCLCNCLEELLISLCSTFPKASLKPWNPQKSINLSQHLLAD